MNGEPTFPQGDEEARPTPQEVVDAAFAPITAERKALTEEAHAALLESEVALAGLKTATTGHLNQLAEGLGGFATALADVEQAREDGILELTEVVPPDEGFEEHEDPTK